MTAPAAAARTTPLGIPLGDGYSTQINIAADTDISFWEKSVTPPSLDGGDAIEHSTMHNDTYRTFGARSLVTLGEVSTTVAWDPDVYDEVLAILNTNTTITIHFPDGSTLAFFGYLRTFEPSDLEEGTQPEASITIQPTNTDPASLGTEAGPVLTEVTGT